jgi:hypothetical protein
MAVKNKDLQRLMKPAAVGEPIDTDSFVADMTVQVAEFAEPFWDPPEQYRASDYDHPGGPLDFEGSATYADNPWDCVTLGQYKLPGLWTVSATPALKLDIQKPIGYDGAAVITRGYLPASLTLTGVLWTGLQWKLMQDIIPAIWRRPNKIAAQDVKLEKGGKISAISKDQGEIVTTQNSLTIMHPSLSPLGIFTVAIRQVTPLVPHSIFGAKQMTIECVEYVPEPAQKKSAVRKVKGQTSARGKDAAEKAIEAKDARATGKPSANAASVGP